MLQFWLLFRWSIDLLEAALGNWQLVPFVELDRAVIELNVGYTENWKKHWVKKNALNSTNANVKCQFNKFYLVYLILLRQKFFIPLVHFHNLMKPTD